MYLLEHNQDPPGDGPLLGTYEPTTFGRRGDLGDVDGNLGGLNADTEPVDDATDDQHSNVLRRANEDRADDPDIRR